MIRFRCLLNLGFFLMIFLFSCKKKDDLVVAPITFNPFMTYGTMTDQDNNTYKTVTIGHQVWMAENLKTTRYRNGETITETEGINVWKQKTSGAYCKYENNNKISDVYGLLYNWYAVNDPRNLAPDGWHIPTRDNWDTLIAFLGYDYTDQLLETGNDHWKDRMNSINSSGFSALPGGIRDRDVFIGIEVSYEYSDLGLMGYWWTSDSSDELYGAYMFISLYIDYFRVNYKDSGLSFRCIKD